VSYTPTQYYRFGGGQDRITLGGPLLAGLSRYTASVSLRYTTLTQGGTFFAEWTASNSARAMAAYQPSGEAQFCRHLMSFDGVTIAETAQSTTRLDLGTWHRVMVRRGGVGGPPQVWIDGVFEDQQENAEDEPIFNGASIFGAGPLDLGNPANAYEGDWANLKVWDVSLGGDDIVDDANGIDVGSPILWWRSDEGSGTTAIDRSGNNRDGTIIVADINDFHQGGPPSPSFNPAWAGQATQIVRGCS
jgi:hypothetical protein